MDTTDPSAIAKYLKSDEFTILKNEFDFELKPKSPDVAPDINEE